MILSRGVYSMAEIKVYTADDEEPNCNRCDNMDASDEFCDKCGSEFWSGYKRTVISNKEV